VAGEGADLAWAEDPTGREAVRAKAFAANMRAGDLARQRYALARAVQLHRDALEIAADDAERQQAHEAMGDDERAWFHGDEAWAAYALGLDIARQRGDGEALARMASHATYLAALFGVFRELPDPAAVHALIEEALPVADDPTARSRLLSARSSTSTLWLRTTGSDPIPAEAREADAREAARLAREVGDAELESLAEEVLTEFYEARGDYAAVLETYRRQVSLLDRIESPSRRAMILLNASSAEFDLAGDHEQGRALALRLYEVAKGLSPHELMHATASLIVLAYWSGRWGDIPALLSEHLKALNSETEQVCGYRSLGPAVAALVEVARGDTQAAKEHLALVSMTPKQAIIGRAAGAEVLVRLGRAEEARDLARQLREEDDRMYWPLLALMEALVALEDWTSLEEVLAVVRPRAAGSVRFGPAADQAEGLRKLAAGDRLEAERLLRQALEAYERIGMPFEAARTRENLAGVSDGAERATLLRAALETYERLDAAPLAERVRAAMIVNATSP
jgi:tetratricopeptide (TPR) repeat protein